MLFISASAAAHSVRHRLAPKRYEQDGWRIYTPRHAPSPDLVGHLTFALKYEGLDLGVLKALFVAAGPTLMDRLEDIELNAIADA